MNDKIQGNTSNNLNHRLLRLQQRQQIISTIRNDLYNEGFLEVETPILVKNTTPEAYIDSIQAGDYYLITSTEYQIKRLIASGFNKIFTLTKNFRANDHGRYHNPEFTMLEWGRAYDTLKKIEKDAMQFIRAAFRKIYPNRDSLSFNENEINFIKDWEYLTVRKAFSLHLGLDDLGDFSLECLCKASKKAAINLPSDFQYDQSLVISFLLDQLQSHLGKERPTFLQEWPFYLTSSAPASLNDPYTVERSELYIGGIEIANGFPFLTDFKIQKELFKKQQAKRKDLKKPIVPIDEKYLDALKNLPPGAGMALGMDRLAMVLTQGTKLSDVLTFDWIEL